MPRLAAISVGLLGMAALPSPVAAGAAVREKLAVQYTRFDEVVQITADWIRERH